MYKPWKASLSSSRHLGDTLTSIAVEPDGTVLATTGSIAAIFPDQIKSDAKTTCSVDASWLGKNLKASSVASIEDSLCVVTHADGSTARLPAPEVTFPNIRAVLPEAESGPEILELGLDAKLLYLLAESLGSTTKTGYQLTLQIKIENQKEGDSKTTLSAIRVKHNASDLSDASACIMPIRIK